jgi:hypothetical protein
MAIFGTHTAPPTARLISAPMHARYVSGVSVDEEPSALQGYFALSKLEPDELPSHTFVAQGKTEIPQSNIISCPIRRRNLSLKRSLSRLRSNSGPHASVPHRRCQSEKHIELPTTHEQSDTELPSPSQICRASTGKRSWTSLGLGRNVVYDAAPRHKASELGTVPAPPPKDLPRPSPPAHVRTISTNSVASSTAEKDKPLPARPRRVDSAAGSDYSDFSTFSVDEEPMCFQNIVAIQDYEERLALYDAKMNYWAMPERAPMQSKGTEV